MFTSVLQKQKEDELTKLLSFKNREGRKLLHFWTVAREKLCPNLVAKQHRIGG